ncbi:MAG: hypothetical protein LLF95_02370 [Bacteroidales bacterium]|nr:hypothetical protein [Bacteroidales bacterium]
MNTTLNINRIGLLLKRFFIENKQRELTFWGITTVIFMSMHESTSVEMFLYISGFIFAARMFKAFSYTPSGMHYLLIPATHTEKLVTSILLSTLYYFAMILLTYIIGNIAGTYLGNLIFSTDNQVHWALFNFGNPANGFNSVMTNSNGFWNIFINFAIIQAIFLLGALYFKRNAIGKTMMTIIGISIVLGIIEVLLLKVTFGTYHFDNQMFNMTIPAGKNLLHGFEIAGQILKYAAVPFLWVVSYFRLTEKEV